MPYTVLNTHLDHPPPMPGATRTLHASAAARNGAGVLLLGPSGAGKSDLAFRLMARGFVLIADDQVLIQDGVATSPPGLEGLLELRGLGIIRVAWAPARLVLAVQLVQGERMPSPARLPELDLPVINVDPGAASAALRIGLALDCLSGAVAMHAGAFA
jgi:HPr kinase/phosphorylase